MLKKFIDGNNEYTENISYDNKNKIIILKFNHSSVKIPFSLIKEFYKNIVKMEEIGMVGSDDN